MGNTGEERETGENESLSLGFDRTASGELQRKYNLSELRSKPCIFLTDISKPFKFTMTPLMNGTQIHSLFQSFPWLGFCFSSKTSPTIRDAFLSYWFKINMHAHHTYCIHRRVIPHSFTLHVNTQTAGPPQLLALFTDENEFL